MKKAKRALQFDGVAGTPGLRRATYRLPESGDDLHVFALGDHVFHVASAARPDDRGETVIVNDVSGKKKGKGGAGLIGLLLDYLTTPPRKNCYTITVITQWPNGKTEIESSRHCD